MLKYLRISNLAVISDVEIECGRGLNLLTGETGSGKSIIVDALALLLGGRASQDMMRSGESRGYVEGDFQLEPGGDPPECLSVAGIEAPDGEIIIRRELHRDGPTRAFVNDRLVMVSLVKELRPHLIDIHGQGDHQTLVHPSAQLKLLDVMAGAIEIREQLNTTYHRYRQKREELEQLLKAAAERWRLLDVYRFQIEEIERIKPCRGEDEELERQRRVLQQAEKLARLASEAYQRLYESDDAMLTAEAQVRRWMHELRQIDDRFDAVIEQLDRARVALEESAFFLREYRDEVVCSPERLQEVEDRLADLHRLKRKYGPGLDEVLENLEHMKRQVYQLSSTDEVREELENELAALASDYTRLAQVLTEKRTAAANHLEQAVVQEMNELALEHGRLRVAFEPVKEVPAEQGIERVEFLVSFNPGEELKPLSRVASGGEMARFMLAIKSVAAADAGAPSLVFDEIDVGIGGRVAERVGLRLKQLAQRHQVFCVTHQPQMARFADAHFRVEKQVMNGHTVVQVQELDRSGRVNELARMMAGAEITDVTRRHARELLQLAR
jgi:DNA repair protein RecN (Recombination protein N)